MKVKSDHLSKFSNLSNWKEEAWKYQGFNGIRNRDLRDTGAMLDQLSCEATHWERGQFVISKTWAKTLTMNQERDLLLTLIVSLSSHCSLRISTGAFAFKVHVWTKSEKHNFLPRKLSVFAQEDSSEFEWLREELVSPLTTRTADLQFLGWPVIGRELAWTRHRLEIGSFLPQYEDYWEDPDEERKWRCLRKNVHDYGHTIN